MADRIEEVLAEHRMYVHHEGDDWNEPAEETLYCSCSDDDLGGWVHTAESHAPPDWEAIQVAHQSAALREAGIGDVAEAERRGAVRALREASYFSTPVDVVFRDLADVRDWLRDRADRLAEDAGAER